MYFMHTEISVATVSPGVEDQKAAMTRVKSAVQAESERGSVAERKDKADYVNLVC